LRTERSRTESSPGSKQLLLAIFALASASLAQAGGPGFRDQDLLDDHFAKYHREFGPITERQYLHLAQQLRDSHLGKNILESRRQSGGIARFDLKHGYFGSYDADGTIRTFFIPPDGIRYFERQAKGNGRGE
jgi:pyocin large subunit-like protein